MNRSDSSLPVGWTEATLDAIADVQLGKMLSAKSKTGQGARPYLRNVNVRWGRIDVDDVLEMDFDAREAAKYELRDGDVLVCEGGEPGRAAVWREQLPGALYQKALHRVRFKEDALDPRLFVYRLELDAARGALARRFTGSTIKHLPREAFLEHRVLVPPRAEQRRIVAAIEEHLSDLDAAVAALERVRANLRRYRAAVLRSAVEGRLDANRNHAEIAVYAPDVVFALPTKWRWSRLGTHLTDIDAGYSFRCEERPPHEGEIGVVKVSAVTWGRFDEEESKTVLDTTRVNESLFVKPGDFLFSRANTIKLVGACVIVSDVRRCIMLSDKILRFRFTEDIVPSWAMVCLRSEWGRYEIERLSTGNQESMRNIGQERIRSIRVPLPPVAEQRRIVSEVERRLTTVERTEAEVGAQLRRAARLRQSILKRAFEGKLVAQDPADEPATVLLERVRTERAVCAPL